MTRDEWEITIERTLQSAGTASLVGIVVGLKPWIPVMASVIALGVELLKRRRADNRVGSFSKRLASIEEKLSTLDCVKTGNCE